MKFLPYENFYIYSDLKPEEVRAKLTEVVSSWSGYIFSLRGPNPAGPWTPFKGFVERNYFEFTPTIIYRNSFLPQIRGTVEDHGDGTKIHVIVALHPLMPILTILILAGSAVYCILVFPELISTHHRAADVAPYLVFLIYSCLATVAFKSESISSRNYLIELFDS